MSRIGQMPISIPQGVKLTVKDFSVTVEGPKGSLVRDISPEIGVDTGENTAVVTRKNESQHVRSLHGLYRSLISNMVQGVSAGFSRLLVINGVGFRAEVQERSLILNLGYSNPIEYPIPDGIEIEVEGNTRMTISSIDKEQLGQVSAEIRSLRPPEPYKGKGVKYGDEIIHRKVGKSGVK